MVSTPKTVKHFEVYLYTCLLVICTWLINRGSAKYNALLLWFVHIIKDILCVDITCILTYMSWRRYRLFNPPSLTLKVRHSVFFIFGVDKTGFQFSTFPKNISLSGLWLGAWASGGGGGGGGWVHKLFNLFNFL